MGDSAVMTTDQIIEKTQEVLIEALGADEDEVNLDASLTADLEAESIDFLDIVFRLEKAFSTDDKPFKIEQGELFPENFLGGYDGSKAYGFPFIDMMEKNYPEIPLAPKAPYLIDMMSGERDHRMMWGATLDFLGYILPKFVFKLHPAAPYLEEADGDHYEETNSIGPRAEEEIVGTMRQLVMKAEGK